MSPYLKDHRLQDIIAAIQVMGSYPRLTSRESEKWDSKLGDPLSGNSWYEVCLEHPEFFRTNISKEKQWVGIRWRWALDKDYHPEQGKRLVQGNIDSLDQEDIKKLTRPPLESTQIEALINSAIQLHARAIEQKRENRWFIPLAVPAIAALLGVLLGDLIGGG